MNKPNVKADKTLAMLLGSPVTLDVKPVYRRSDTYLSVEQFRMLMALCTPDSQRTMKDGSIEVEISQAAVNSNALWEYVVVTKQSGNRVIVKPVTVASGGSVKDIAQFGSGIQIANLQENEVDRPVYNAKENTVTPAVSLEGYTFKLVNFLQVSK